MIKENKEYYAFISYKREDEKWAKWLAHELAHYKLPTTLNGKDLPKNLRPIFRDVDELSAGNLPAQIFHALSISKNLIVICSPRAAHSEWVNKEIEDFIAIKGGKADHIYPFIIEGSAFSKDPSNECFPEKLRTLPDSEERLAGNINEQGGKRAALVKVVAGMLGLEFDSLWKKYEREQKKKHLFVVVGIALVAVLALIIAWWMYSKNVSLENSNRKVLENQGRFVAKQMNTLIDEGDLYTTILLGTELLTQDDRPYVPQIEIALRRAYDSICSVGLHPVSVLKYTMSEPYGTGRPSIVSFSSDSKHIQIAYEWELEGTNRPICEYSALTGELIKEKTVDYVCEDSMETMGFERNIIISDDSVELWSPDKSYMLKVYDNRCVIYKKNHSPNHIKYPVGWSPSYVHLEKNSISKDSKYIIIGDSVYLFLSGKSVRPMAASSRYEWAEFSPDDKYIVTFSDEDSVYVEDFQTGKIIYKVKTSENASPSYFDEKGNLFIHVWEDSFYVYKIPTLEILSKGISKEEEKGYNIDVQGKDVIVLLNGKPYQAIKEILPEEPIHSYYVGFEMLDDNKKILITYVYECMLWDLSKKALLNRWYFGNNRFNGVRFNNNRSQMLSYNGFEVTIYDTNSGLVLLDKKPSEDSLDFNEFGATYSRDERYIVHSVYNKYRLDECSNWYGMVYIYEFLPTEELIEKCRECIGDRKLTHKEMVEFYLDY